MYKKGDKVIILDYNGKPLVPHVVAEIEDVYGPDRVRLLLPDNACCLEFTDRFEPIDEETYDSYLHSVHEREKEIPVDLQIDIRKFASKHPRRRMDEIIKKFDLDKRYCSILNAYLGRVRMYGKENINERFLYEYNEALYGIIETRTFFHDLDPSIKIPDLN
ncbi:hypothetical protein [Butyrivibrio sp. YAB3001]|uniref:hypothetical protein n=1 Tax=Butyrivibrio sp. YAB3001 TaxID=1520812 RepID=UPI0008F66426|nr:hypothetical protein [Butyrivibrio sp. YAB3001]SFC84202.1 hypothetical protein SAMN02910398_03285 [Butyrivibrio sp. YAB3001]